MGSESKVVWAHSGSKTLLIWSACDQHLTSVNFSTSLDAALRKTHAQPHNPGVALSHAHDNAASVKHLYYISLSKHTHTHTHTEQHSFTAEQAAFHQVQAQKLLMTVWTQNTQSNSSWALMSSRISTKSVGNSTKYSVTERNTVTNIVKALIALRKRFEVMLIHMT